MNIKRSQLETLGLNDMAEGKAKPSKQPLHSCPQCASERLYRDGFRYLRDGSTIQRWLCRECGSRFNETQLSKGCHTKYDNSKCALFKTKNLLKAIALTEAIVKNDKWAVGATAAEIKGLLAVYTAKAAQRGLKEITIRNRIAVLERLAKRGAELNRPESVWKHINTATKTLRDGKQKLWAENTKRFAAIAYKHFCKVFRISIPEDFNFSKWKTTQELPFIPLEKEVDQLIAGCNSKTAAFLQLLKETGIRCGEAWKLKWTDFDFEQNILTVNKTEKRGNPRQFRISDRLIAMLRQIRKDDSERLWKGELQNFRVWFQQQRKRMAFKLQNPRIKRIHFHTLRHFYATMLYHKTKDILLVKEKLGHRSINSTMIYTQLLDFRAEEYHSATARTVEDGEKLIEQGFEYVCDFDGIRLFRKRK